MAEPDPSNVSPWYLRNINQALALDETTGTVYLNTNASIVGNVTIGASVDSHVSELGNIDISGNTMPATVYQGTSPWVTTGNVNANITGGNVNAAVTGTVTANQGTNPWVVTGNVAVTDQGSPWNLQVAQGLVPGVTGLSISGYGSNIGTTFQPAWEGGTYTFLNTAQQLRVWSDSASDTNVSVLINGLDASYNVLNETVVITNGSTGVLTTNNFFRVNNISLTRMPQNVGNIRVGTSDKTNTLAFFDTGTDGSAGRSQQTVYTVPAGYTFYLTQSNWYTNQTGSQTALYRSWTRNPAGLVMIVLTFPMQQQYNSTKVVPRPYPEKTDIQWQVASSSGSSRIGGQIEGYLIAN